MNAESVHTCSWPVQALRRVSGPGDAQLCQAPFSPSAWGDTGLPVWLRTPPSRGQDWDAEARPQKQKSDHKVCRCFYPTGGMVTKMFQQCTRRSVQEEKPAEVWFHQRFIDEEGCKIKSHLAKWWKSKSLHNHSL